MLFLALGLVVAVSVLVTRSVNKKTRVNVTRNRIPRLAEVERYEEGSLTADLTIRYPGFKGEETRASLEVPRNKYGMFPAIDEEVWIYLNPFKPEDISLRFEKVSNLGDVTVAFLFSMGLGLTLLMSCVLLWG